MTQIVPATARLSARRDGSAIGVAVLTIVRTEFRPWTQAGVVNTPPGLWAVSGGVAVPDGGGYVVWSESDGKIIAESTVDPLPPTAPFDALLRSVQEALATLLPRLAALVPTPPAPIVETSGFVGAVTRLQADLSALVQAGHEGQAQRVAELEQSMTPIAEIAQRLPVIEQVATELGALSVMSQRLGEVLDNPPYTVRVVAHGGDPTVLRTLDAVKSDVDRLTALVAGEQAAGQKLKRSVQALDKFLVAVGSNDHESGNV